MPMMTSTRIRMSVRSFVAARGVMRPRYPSQRLVRPFLRRLRGLLGLLRLLRLCGGVPGFPILLLLDLGPVRAGGHAFLLVEDHTPTLVRVVVDVADLLDQALAHQVRRLDQALGRVAAVDQ